MCVLFSIFVPFFEAQTSTVRSYVKVFLITKMKALCCEKLNNKNRTKIIVYAYGRRLCSNRFRHGSTTISYPQCSLTFLRERYLHRCREQSFAIRAYAMSAVGIDVLSVHKLFAYRVVSTFSTDIVSSPTKYCRITYGITR